MDKLVIEGGQPVRGCIKVSGAKNAALPILAATILLDEPCVISNIPHLNDVTTMMELLGELGVNFTINENMDVTIDTQPINSFVASYALVKTMRASVLVLGPLLARYGKAEVSLPGGCAIGPRPINLHIEAMEKLGAEVTIEDGLVKASVKGRLRGSEIHFNKVTVTGTENVVMAAVLAEGKTTIYNAAQEPEVNDLAHFLNKMGAKISGIGTSTLVIEGVERLGKPNVHYSVLPDRIEAGTYLIAAAMSRGEITLKDVAPDLLDEVLVKLEEAGAKIKVNGNQIHLSMKTRPKSVSVVTAPYPGFPTDLQAQILALNTVAEGEAKVVETIFENRFMHLQELNRLGAEIALDGNVATVTGKEKLTGAPVMATDLRASACLVLAAIVANGKTIIDRVYHIDRGYECIEEKLLQLGVKVKRVSDR